MINVKCPCCHESFSFGSYISQEFQKNSLEDGELNTICKKCNKVILLSNHNKKYGLFIAVFYFFIIIYLIIMKLLTTSIVIGLFILYVLVQYIEYRNLNFKCYTKEEINNIEKDYKADILAIVTITFIFFSAIIFGFYSFATSIKQVQQNKQSIIKAKQGESNGHIRQHGKNVF